MVDVVVVGAGPTGMMLAAELQLAGVEVEVVERRPTPDLVGSRAGGFHARTIEILDQRGIADRFLAEGKTFPLPYSGTTMLDISDLPTRHPYTLGLFQNRIERILADWLDELGVRVRRGRAVTDFAQDDAGVEVRLDDGTTLPAQYLVGADGGRSAIRKAAGIEFPGWEATTSSLIAEVEMTEPTPPGITFDERGLHGMSLMEDGRTTRVVTTEGQVSESGEPTLDDLRANLIAVFGTDFGARNPTWISRFSNATRQAASYRSGRVLVAGDAAHIHSPAGGQGIGLGIQDAVNLGWKLAQVVKGVSTEQLLDSYHVERHPATARALQYSMAANALQQPGPRVAALRDLLDTLVVMDEPRRHIAGLVTGLDIRYDLGTGHPLLGRRMPDLDVVIAGEPTTVYSLLHAARPVLMNLGDESLDPGPWAERVDSVHARSEGEWLLPSVGPVAAPSAALIRPDGHVCWVGEGTRDGLEPALATWFGPAVR